MVMKKENVAKLAFYLKLIVIDPKYSPSITCSWNHEYLEIFLDECDRGDGVPLKYEDFREEMWDHIQRDPDFYPHIENDFKNVWNGWFQIYSHLKNKDRILDQ